MKTILFATLLTIMSTGAYAQKTNLDKLPEKERNEYLLKTAYKTVMKHAPEWYRDFKEPLIESGVFPSGSDKDRLVYSVTYFHDPSKEFMGYGFSILVGIYADTGAVRDFSFGDGAYYKFPTTGTRSGEKPFYRPYTKVDTTNRENTF